MPVRLRGSLLALLLFPTLAAAQSDADPELDAFQATWQRPQPGVLVVPAGDPLTASHVEALLAEGVAELRLQGPTRLAPGAAQALSNFGGRTLAVGVADLDRATAQRLAAAGCWRLELPALPALTLDAAQALSAFTGTELDLSGLRRLTPAAAAALSDFFYDQDGGYRLSADMHGVVRAEGISLAGLETLDEATARAMHRFLQRGLSLPRLTQLDPATARALVQGRVAQLRLGLDGLTSLDSALAQELAAYPGKVLSLGGLPALSPEAAAALATYGQAQAIGPEYGRPRLALDGLESLDAAAAAALVDLPAELTLNGLRRLDAETAATLRAIGGGDALTQRSPFPIVSADELGEQDRRWLLLDRLEALEAETAAQLASWPEHLGISLGGLTSLDPPAAAALAGGERPLALNGLAALTPELAQALAQHPGALRLDGVTALTQATASALADCPGPLYMRGLAALAPGVADALAAVPNGVFLAEAQADAFEAARDRRVTRLAQALNTADGLAAASAQDLALLDRKLEHLDLPDVTRLDPTGAAKLAGLQRSELSLGLTTLDAATAAALSAAGAPALRLDALPTLAPDVAAALGPYTGWLSLGGLTALDPATARGLGQAKKLTLPGVSALEPGVLASLEQVRELALGVVELTPGVAAALAALPELHALELDGVARLDLAAVRALGSSRLYELSLRGLRELDPATARLLQCARRLRLGLQSLTPETARALFSAKVFLFVDLSGLTALPVAVARQCRDHGLTLDPGVSLSPAAAELLAQHADHVKFAGVELEEQVPAVWLPHAGLSWHVGMVREAAERGDLAEALGQLEQALIEQERSEPEALRPSRTAELLRRRARMLLAAGDQEGALDDALRSVDLDPAHPSGHLLLGQAQLALGEAGEALAPASAAIEQDPTDAAAFALRAAVRLALGEVEAAHADASQATTLEPLLAEAWLRRGQATAGDPQQGLADLRHAYALASEDSWQRVPADPSAAPVKPRDYPPEVRHCLDARKYEQDAALDDALAAVDRVVDGWPAFAPGWHLRARILEQRGDLEAALLDEAQAARCALGAAAAERGPDGLRSRIQRQAQALQLDDAFRRTAQGEVAYLDAKAGGALLEDLSRGLLVWPDADWLVKQRAALRAGLGDPSYAVVELMELITRSERDAPWLETLGYAQAARGQYAAALETLARAGRQHCYAGQGAMIIHNDSWICEPLPGQVAVHLKARSLPGALGAQSAYAEFHPPFKGLRFDLARLQALNDDREGALKNLRLAVDAPNLWPYPALWIAALGGDAEAALATPPDGANVSPWVRALIQHAQGTLDAAALLATAEAAEEPLGRRQRLCEARLYVGLQLEFQGQADEARAHYEACVATQVEDYIEFQWAQLRLSR